MLELNFSCSKDAVLQSLSLSSYASKAVSLYGHNVWYSRDLTEIHMNPITCFPWYFRRIYWQFLTLLKKNPTFAILLSVLLAWRTVKPSRRPRKKKLTLHG